MSKNIQTELQAMILDDPRVAVLQPDLQKVALKLAWFASQSRDRISLPRPRVLADLLHTDESTVLSNLEFLIKAGLVFRDAARFWYFQWIEQNELDYL
jgi:hypothetical protein